MWARRQVAKSARHKGSCPPSRAHCPGDWRQPPGWQKRVLAASGGRQEPLTPLPGAFSNSETNALKPWGRGGSNTLPPLQEGSESSWPEAMGRDSLLWGEDVHTCPSGPDERAKALLGRGGCARTKRRSAAAGEERGRDAGKDPKGPVPGTEARPGGWRTPHPHVCHQATSDRSLPGGGGSTQQGEPLRATDPEDSCGLRVKSSTVTLQAPSPTPGAATLHQRDQKPAGYTR